MNLVVDYGNTRAKAGFFRNHELIEQFSFQDKQALKGFLVRQKADHLIICSVVHDAEEMLTWGEVKGRKLILKANLPLPITIAYETPDTLGTDRIAAVCGAWNIFPYRNCLVIDAGTCITYEFLDASGTYHGGAISPGVHMRLQALHTFTARLPLVSLEKDVPLIGTNTRSSIQSGVLNGMISEIKGMIEQYELRYPDLGVILCGGDYYLFENQLKPSIFVAPELVLKGLNRILLHNAGLQ